jgi:hypothetical protein
MMIPAVASAARRRFAGVARQQIQQKRSMGGHAPAPEWEGIDKVVRGYFPHDHQREFFVSCVVVEVLCIKIPDSLFLTLKFPPFSFKKICHR